MKLNQFQQAEVNHHNDAELLWLIQSKIEAFQNDEKNFKDGKFNTFLFCKEVGIVVAKAIAEREGFHDKYHQLTEKETADCLWKSYTEKFPKSNEASFKSWEELICPLLDNLIYQSLLRTRVPLQETSLIDNYWPFNQEGGFCNPNKLNMIED
jgi:hypothetical protein